jgi:hypothetical protein
MRATVLSFLVASGFVAACASNAAELQRARDARYRGDPAAMSQLAAQATEAQHYHVGQIDRDTGAFLTVDKVFGPDGDTESAGAGDTYQIKDRSIVLAFLVSLRPTEDVQTFTLSVEPKIRRAFVDRGNTDELSVDDPTVPGWVHTRIEELTIALHDALAAYELKTPPQP